MGLLFIESSLPVLLPSRASAPILPSRLSPHRFPCGSVSVAVESDPQPTEVLNRIQFARSPTAFALSQEMPRKATGESYHWDQAKETVFLQKLDYYVACNSGKHPPLPTLESWANEFNSAYGGVPAYGITLQQKKDRMRKIYRGWKALQCWTGLGYDPLTDRVICSDDAWHSFIQVI